MKQCVVRTFDNSDYTWAIRLLKSKLEEGWNVKLVNPVGKNLEYILEKAEEVNKDF